MADSTDAQSLPADVAGSLTVGSLMPLCRPGFWDNEVLLLFERLMAGVGRQLFTFAAGICRNGFPVNPPGFQPTRSLRQSIRLAVLSHAGDRRHPEALFWITAGNDVQTRDPPPAWHCASGNILQDVLLACRL